MNAASASSTLASGATILASTILRRMWPRIIALSPAAKQSALAVSTAANAPATAPMLKPCVSSCSFSGGELPISAQADPAEKVGATACTYMSASSGAP